MIAAIIFVLVAAVLCGLALLACFGIAHVAMSDSETVERDGLHPGQPAPAWSLTDSTGRRIESPPAKPLQMVVFADHSLKSFPSVVDGLKQVARPDDDELETVILLRSASPIAEPVLRMLGLDEIPVVTGSPSLYGRYNVRVLPFVIFVDSAGTVRASSLVNYEWQIAKLRQLADLPLAEPAPSAGRRLRRLTSAAGG
jgi:hypothetical protein